MTTKSTIARRITGGRLAIFDEEDGKMRRVAKFNNPAWNTRREAIAKRVARKQGLAHKRAVLRRGLKKPGTAK